MSGWCQTILLLHIGDTKYLQNSEIEAFRYTLCARYPPGSEKASG